MADVAVAKVQGADDATDVRTYLWEALTAANAAGAAIEIPTMADMSVQAIGTFDSATLVWVGSNDGTNFVTLNDPYGTPISLTAAGLRQVMEMTRYVKPSTSGGGGSQDIDVYLHCKRVA